ncbi:hypothetical protein TVAG_394810 [Trichomonas vaginalis G3]|uniref:DUF3447 domain-containing protein n=1 Tax=Trichomonas vaginalis (strain ATCC PRA-98 / G3) TaxID=412133 RepID=A2EDE5_TRIV3|nr:ankyrin repeat and SOCS box-containing protein 4 family [Trichomonas vaginalis G3]EAY09309.1 hypothetical protein TVAG_394810 [Trichomonas vaginalis G3]KAI5510874.1 ankyrin repeat and SOCS box-containing protein 4 family [Trichomonas vaginalis G3]|eukprot:XP_001321532.1 hypothetical protein [Trichomonas vaginalis G3]
MDRFFNSKDKLKLISDVVVRGKAKFRADLEYEIIKMTRESSIEEIVKKVNEHHKTFPCDTDPILRFIFKLAMNRPLMSSVYGVLFNLIKTTTNVYSISLPFPDRIFNVGKEIQENKSIKNYVKQDMLNELIEYAADSYANLEPLFKTAVKYGAVNCFKFLLNNEVNISFLEAKYALFGGNYEIIRYFDEKGIDFSSLLMVAAEYYRDDIVDWILERYNINFRHFYIHYGNTTMKSFFFLRKKNVVFFYPSLSSLYQTTDILFRDILKAFLINTVEESFQNSSAGLNYEVMIQMEDTLDVDFCTENVVMEASLVGASKVIDHLLDKARGRRNLANISLKNGTKIKNVEITKSSIKHGANVNDEEYLGSINYFSPKILDLLLENGLDKDKMFDMAVQNYRNDMAVYLSKKGVDLEEGTVFQSLLHRNIEKEHILEAIKLSRNCGKKCLQIAVSFGDQEIINEVLKRNGEKLPDSDVLPNQELKNESKENVIEMIDPFISVDNAKHLILRGGKLKSTKPLLTLFDAKNMRVLDLFINLAENVAPALYKAHKEREDIVEKFILNNGVDEKNALRSAIKMQNINVALYLLLNGKFDDLSQELQIAQSLNNREMYELVLLFVK